jgi:predicted amidohydrolase
MIIALASPGIASTLEEGLDKIKRFVSEASAQGAAIVCFPEAYLPGLRGQDFAVLPFDQMQQARVLQAVAQWARTYAVPTILGMERLTEVGRLYGKTGRAEQARPVLTAAIDLYRTMDMTF